MVRTGAQIVLDCAHFHPVDRVLISVTGLCEAAMVPRVLIDSDVVGSVIVSGVVPAKRGLAFLGELGTEGPGGPTGAGACGSELGLGKTPQSQGGPRRPGARPDPYDGHGDSAADRSVEVDPEPPD